MALARKRGLARTGPPKRRTPLRSGRGPAPSALRPGTRRSLRRGGPLRVVSDRKAAESAAAQPVVEEVYRRDRRCLLAGHRDAGPCVGQLTPHHLLKQSSQRGGWTRDNLVALCVRHNGWVEDHPDMAWSLGLVVRRGENVADAWRRLHAHGLVPRPLETP